MAESAVRERSGSKVRRFHVDGEGTRKGHVVAWGAQYPNGLCVVEMESRTPGHDAVFLTFADNEDVDAFFMSIGDGCLGWDDSVGEFTP